tara:strand:+ start:530 stop:688 length:159 start_codon:yes stop_codon:yes gene_type:complete
MDAMVVLVTREKNKKKSNLPSKNKIAIIRKNEIIIIVNGANSVRIKKHSYRL